MDSKKAKNLPSALPENFSSTTKLADNEVRLQVGSRETINEKDDLYNPFDHRVVEHPNSTLGSLAHLLKSSLGSGILAMPMAFRNGGLVFAGIGTLILGFLCTHSVHILVRSSHELCRRSKTPVMGFSETAEAAFQHGPKPVRKFARSARIFVDVGLILTYYTGNCVYVVFISNSIQQLCSYYWPEISDWDLNYFMVMLLVPLILLCQIRELKYMVPFSAMANGFIVVCFGITLYYMFSDIPGAGDKDLVASYTQLPQFFSTVIFAMEGIGVVMPVENNMKKPHHFLGCPGVLNVAMSIVVALYGTIGFFGYLRYGSSTESSITFNLPTEEIAAQIAKILIALAIFFTYSLQFFVPIDILWRKIVSPRVSEAKHNLAQVLMRTVMVAGTVGLAILVHDLEAFIGLVGAVFFSILGLFTPAVVETITYWDTGLGKCKWMLLKNIFLVLLALFALVTGSYTSLKQIVEQYQ